MKHYKDNRESLITYLERVHQGGGFKLSSSSSSGLVEILEFDSGKSLGEFPYMNGEFYKVLEEGRYKFLVNDHTKKEVSSLAVTVDKLINQNGNFLELN